MVNKENEIELPFEIEKVLIKNYDKEYKTNKLVLKPYETFAALVK